MLTKSEYEKIKQGDKDFAKGLLAGIQESKDPTVKYKDSRPVTDMKNMLETSCEIFAENTAFMVKDKKGGEYREIKYKQLLQDVNGLGTALIEAGFKDKRVAVIGENSYKWAVSYLAVTGGVGVVVPLDKSLQLSELEHLVDVADVRCVICDKKYVAGFEGIMKSNNTQLECIINMNGETSQDGLMSWDEMLQAGKNLVIKDNRQFLDAQVIAEDMVALLFTSGTTGASKGVMLSHRNIIANLMCAPTILLVKPDDVFFSFLPIHHSYECTCGFLMPIYKGAAIAYCEGLKYIVKNLSEARPTFFLGVPALFENLYKKIWASATKSGKDGTLRKAIKINRITKKIGLDLGGIFFKDIRALFGGRMRMIICGGAAINPTILDGIADFGITALQGYGLTECSPMGALNPDTAPKSSSLGKAFPTYEARIDNPDENGMGEICLKGPNIMMGYYQRPDLTAEVLRDGWFYTGDLGYMDKDGYIYMSGRKKNVIIAKNGKNIYPEELEYYLSNSPIIKESMIWGRKTSNKEDTIVVASIRIDDEAITELLGENPDEKDVMKALWREVDRVNEDLPFFKKIKDIVLRKEDFEKNTSLKIKRFVEENKN
ncbi:MAG: AMP-binding protein [Eubacteriales bacterium]|nr:AMP-binding protein [Eubacteriales bacterium]MDD4390076.1 AMP-binding protein [Eubacteriales bacterium]